MPTAGRKFPVSTRALVQRINRKLREKEQAIRTVRWIADGDMRRENSDLGRHYLLHYRENRILETHIDVEAFGRELGVLREWEQLNPDDED